MSSKRKVLVDFLNDRLFYIAVYWINSLLLILFFNLLHAADSIEVLYPLGISLLLFFILMIYQWIQYDGFNRMLARKLEDIHYGLKPGSREHRLMMKVLDQTNEQCMGQISSMRNEHERQLQFFSQWLHSLKTYVSVTDLILHKECQSLEEHETMMLDIRTENERLNAGIDQILSLLRLEHFERDYEAQPFDLAEALKKVINEKKNQFIYNNVFPVVESAKDEMWVVSDLKWNKQLLEQMISNAIKYSAETLMDKKIYFRLWQNENHVMLSIEDEGIGIPDYDLSRVFEPFFTGENGRKFRNSTGIGLFICKEITRRLGQDLEITSIPNKGTVVTVTYLSKL